MTTYEEGLKEEEYMRFERIVKAWIVCLGSFSLSMIGGLLLIWWGLKYHPNNEQLWMVPLGLILFVTPVIVWLSVIISDACISNQSDDSARARARDSSGKQFQGPEKQLMNV